jgi:hypothetical protein
MPGWFTPVIIVLALAALGFLVAFWTTRKRKYAGGLAACLILLPVIWFIASRIPTDQRAIEAAMNDILAGLRNRSADQVFRNVAASFKYRSSDRASFRQRADRHITAGDAADVEAWDFNIDKIDREAKQAEVHFNVRSPGITASGREFFLCRAKFILENDGKWRMQTFDLYNPFVETNRAIDIPGVN